MARGERAARVFAALARVGRVTAVQFSVDAGVHISYARAILKGLHQQGRLHIAGWEKDSLGRDSTPVYSFGEGVDVRRTTFSRSEVMRRYRERKQKARHEQSKLDT